ncbi:MAG: membrane integrity-associated transporter subunit PqiC [Proteobacteria bacterium]|nr:membrane integrity-associated transporter subunit PqiC [Pseudomonadota bacterium]
MRAARLIVVLALALPVGGCGGSAPVPRDHYYRLEVAPPERALSAPLFDGALEVRRFLADGLLAERALLFSRREASFELDRYDYHYWVEPPSRLLQEELVAFLRQANIARAVITSEQRAGAPYVLTGKIRRLERLVGATGASVLVELELGVGQGGERGLEVIQVYRAERPAAESGIPATVAAYGQAVGGIFRAFLADLTRKPPVGGR